MSSDLMSDGAFYGVFMMVVFSLFDIYFFYYFYQEFIISLAMKGEYERFHWYTCNRYNGKKGAKLEDWEEKFWPNEVNSEKKKRELELE